MEAAMMGERSGSQGRFFYRFDLEERVPADHLLRKIDAVLDLSEAAVAARAALQPYWSALDRSGADDPDAADRLLLRHPIRAAAV